MYVQWRSVILKKLGFHSIKNFILVGVLIGVLVTLFMAKLYTETQTEKKLYSTFEKTRQELTTNIANIMINPLQNFSPSEASSALEIAKQDSKIVKIYIHDTILDLSFIDIYIPARKIGSLYKNSQIIYNSQKKEIGFLEITFNDVYIQEQLDELNKMIKMIIVLVVVVLFIIVSTLLHYKIFLPLKTLMKQAENFKSNELQNAYEWKGKDELSDVGRSFELARVSILSLINQLSHKNEELEKLYVTDKLTGLYNRHKLDKELVREEHICTRYNHSFGIILIDIDDFKFVNDTYGHLVGDKVLIDIANILKENVRKSDIVGRWGGEEFLIIVPQANKKDLLEVSNKLKDFISNYDHKLSKKITASFGISIYKDNITTLIKNADDALYHVKSNGKNEICINF